MDSRVDLDQVAGLISRHAFAWKQSGLVVGALEYRGGDPSDEPVLETPGWDDWMDLPGIERLLQRFADLFDRTKHPVSGRARARHPAGTVRAGSLRERG